MMTSEDKTVLFPWGDLRRFNSYKHFLSDKWGGRVQKLTLDAGFTCPNRDGTVGVNGCTYCLNAAFNPSYCSPVKSITQQIDEGIEFHQKRYHRADHYLAYFQAFSNTHAPLPTLIERYEAAIQHPLVKGIVIGTRPDCIDDQKLDYLQKLNEKMFVSIEYGIESCNNQTLIHINRGHTFEQAVIALEKTSARNIHTGAHFIFGLPNENPTDWYNHLAIINKLKINSIKFHQLQIIRHTEMENEYNAFPERFYPFTMESYIDFIAQYITRLNPHFIIERFAGEVPPRYLAVNNWGLTRYDVVLQKIEQLLEKNNYWQGKYC